MSKEINVVPYFLEYAVPPHPYSQDNIWLRKNRWFEEVPVGKVSNAVTKIIN